LSDTDIRAAQLEQEFNDTSQDILDEVQLQHHILMIKVNKLFSFSFGRGIF